MNCKVLIKGVWKDGTIIEERAGKVKVKTDCRPLGNWYEHNEIKRIWK
jgi:hypothetical protein